MFNKSILIILVLLITILISGCTTTKNSTNGTFGEKTISIKNLTIIDNVTTDNFDRDGTNYYYIDGFIENNNKYDAYHVKIKAIVYDADGNIVATNDSAYLKPPNIPTGSQSEFIFTFKDPDQKIVRYELQIISADATF